MGFGLIVNPHNVHHALISAEGIATVVIAIYVAFIGTFQWVTAREKLRLDLYNRRFDVYVSALDFMQALSMWNDIPHEQKHPKRVRFIQATRESRFLFADEPRILALLEEFNTRSFQVTGYEEHLKPYFAAMPKEVMASYNEKQSNIEWITASIEQLEVLLTPYLAFRQRAFRS
jgi:hypothetical protein